MYVKLFFSHMVYGMNSLVTFSITVELNIKSRTVNSFKCVSATSHRYLAHDHLIDNKNILTALYYASQKKPEMCTDIWRKKRLVSLLKDNSPVCLLTK